MGETGVGVAAAAGAASRNRDIWNRDKESAIMVIFPGTWSHKIMKLSMADIQVSFLSNFIIIGDFDLRFFDDLNSGMIITPEFYPHPRPLVAP